MNARLSVLMLLQPRLATLTYAAPHLIVSQSMTYAMQLFDPRPVAKDLALRRTAISMSLEPTPVDAPRKPRAGEPNMFVAEETEVAVAGAAAVTTEENKLFEEYAGRWTATPADGHPEAVPCDATVSDAKLTTRTYADGAKEWEVESPITFQYRVRESADVFALDSDVRAAPPPSALRHTLRPPPSALHHTLRPPPSALHHTLCRPPSTLHAPRSTLPLTQP